MLVLLAFLALAFSLVPAPVPTSRVPTLKRGARGEVSNSPAASGYVTVLSVSGAAGVLRYLRWAHTTGVGDAYVRITVDGGTPLYFLAATASGTATNYVFTPPPSTAISEGTAPSVFSDSGYRTASDFPLDILRFTSSLLIEIKGNGSDDLVASAVVE